MHIQSFFRAVFIIHLCRNLYKRNFSSLLIKTNFLSGILPFSANAVLCCLHDNNWEGRFMESYYCIIKITEKDNKCIVSYNGGEGGYVGEEGIGNKSTWVLFTYIFCIVMLKTVRRPFLAMPCRLARGQPRLFAPWNFISRIFLSRTLQMPQFPNCPNIERKCENKSQLEKTWEIVYTLETASHYQLLQKTSFFSIQDNSRRHIIIN